jgi:ATP-dependent Lon protease
MTKSLPASMELPLLPLRGMLVFPHVVVPLEVGRQRSLNALDSAMLQDEHYIVLAAQKQAQIAEPEVSEVYTVGTLCEIKQLLKLPENRIRVLVYGIRRVAIRSFLQEEPYYSVLVEQLEEPVELTSEIQALMRTALREWEKYIRLGKKSADEILTAMQELDDPAALADSISGQLTIPIEERQAVLEILDPAQRLERLCAVLIRETEILELEKRIQLRVRKQMEKAQREYYLREQIKAIQKELGEQDGRLTEIEELSQRIQDAKLPKIAREKALRELDRLERMPPMAAEAVVVRNYLDWILNLPWSSKTKDRLDIKAAEEILAQDHYGLDKVKERILEFLAVRQLARKVGGPILCLVGPPGVGKTSLARSVATAMGRRFYRFSLGGVRDEAEIRGHRRTYVGSMPGKILQAMRSVGSQNPVILLDEVDKMSADFRGDPTAALLEVLDPEQNKSFGDHYLEIPFDLSPVLFITTANVLYEVPGPLRDRMEIIQIPGYTEEEKLQIARRHLIPKQLDLHGLKSKRVTMSESAIRNIISGYTREAGVRSLERNIASISRKIAREVVTTGQDRQVRVTLRSLGRYLGQPRFRCTVAETDDRVGVATGLAYTEVGGDILQIEATVARGKGQLILTGRLGEVMRESAQAAFSYVRTRADDFGIESDFHERYDVHIHVPEGGVPKDGPSAGITIVIALVSALSGRPVVGGWAMTGEITLRGRVLPIGGVKEKVLAAHRSGIANVILPLENEPDLDDIPSTVRKHMHFELVNHVDRVVECVLGTSHIPALLGENHDQPEFSLPDSAAHWGHQPQDIR